MHERARAVPGLHLGAEDDLRFAVVLPTSVEQRLEHAVDRARHLGAERADVVHWHGVTVLAGLGGRGAAGGVHTEYVEGVRRVGAPGDDEGAEGGLESHCCRG